MPLASRHKYVTMRYFTIYLVGGHDSHKYFFHKWLCNCDLKFTIWIQRPLLPHNSFLSPMKFLYLKFVKYCFLSPSELCLCKQWKLSIATSDDVFLVAVSDSQNIIRFSFIFIRHSSTRTNARENSLLSHNYKTFLFTSRKFHTSLSITISHPAQCDFQFMLKRLWNIA